MNKLLIVASLVFLSGCSSAAIRVSQGEGVCEVSGDLFSATVREQTTPETDSAYDFLYSGDGCNVHVWSNP